MKIAELNIGLSSKSLGGISPETAIHCLGAMDFKIISKRFQESVSNDGKEICLAVKVELPKNWQYNLGCIADTLGQDCIAVVGFIGQSPYDTFAPSLWVSPEIPASFNGWTKETFLSYLQNQIIPDSYASGFEGYASDLETALHFLTH